LRRRFAEEAEEVERLCRRARTEAGMEWRGRRRITTKKWVVARGPCYR
jgi:hypothetical protein